MNLTLKRNRIDLYGAFGELLDEKNILVCVTLEHAYPVGLKDFAPKLPSGIYKCVRGMHCLLGKNPFITFEITGVSGHVGILFHCGNTNNDSEGCVLLGSERGTGCILDSRVAFEKFMALQENVGEFTLTVA